MCDRAMWRTQGGARGESTDQMHEWARRKRSGVRDVLKSACQGATQIIFGAGVRARKSWTCQTQNRFHLSGVLPRISRALAIHRSAMLQLGQEKRWRICKSASSL